MRLYLTPGREERPAPVALVLVQSLPPDLDAMRARGLRLVSLPLGQEPSLLGGVKSTSYALNMVAVDEARRRGADDALFLGPQGVVLEGPTRTSGGGAARFSTRRRSTSASSRRDPRSPDRARRRPWLRGRGRRLPLTRVTAAEEAFTSSAVREVMPVVESTGRRSAAELPARPRGSSGRIAPVRFVFLIAKTVHGGLYRLSGGRIGSPIPPGSGPAADNDRAQERQAAHRPAQLLRGRRRAGRGRLEGRRAEASRLVSEPRGRTGGRDPGRPRAPADARPPRRTRTRKRASGR